MHFTLEKFGSLAFENSKFGKCVRVIKSHKNLRRVHLNKKVSLQTHRNKQLLLDNPPTIPM
jgi:hypothetical protein